MAMRTAVHDFGVAAMYIWEERPVWECMPVFFVDTLLYRR